MNGKGQVAAILTVGAAAFSGGVALGHFLAQKKVQQRIDEELNRIWREQMNAKKNVQTTHGIVRGPDVAAVDGLGRGILDDPRESPERVITRGRLESVSLVADENAPGRIISVDDEPYGTGTGPEVAEHILDVATTNIFDTSIPGWDYEKELNERSEKDIYIITYDEFYGDELHYKQDQLTYYQGDDVLVDSMNKPVHNYHRFVGDEMKFGHGSKDPNVVFIRNEKQMIEWEIALDTGRYETEVLGLDVEEEYEEKDLKHSAVQKFRRE